MWLYDKLALARRSGLGFRSRGVIIVALLIVVVVTFAVLGQFAGTTISPAAIRNYLAGLGMGGPIALIVVLASVLVIPIIPASLFQIGAGLAFGPILGLVYVVVSDLMGASFGFLLARRWGRSILSRHLSNDNQINVHALSQRLNWRGIVLLRLLPGPVYPLVSFAAGYSPIGYMRFILASILGVLPGLVLLVLAGDLGEQSPLLALALIVGIILALAIASRFANSKR